MLLVQNLLEICARRFPTARSISWVRKQTSFYASMWHAVSRRCGWLACHTRNKQLGFQPFLVHSEDCLHVDCCDMTKGLPTDLLWHWKEKGFLLANDTVSIHFLANISHQELEKLFYNDCKTIPTWYIEEEIIWLVLGCPNLPPMTGPSWDLQKHLSSITLLPCSGSQITLVELLQCLGSTLLHLAHQGVLKSNTDQTHPGPWIWDLAPSMWLTMESRGNCAQLLHMIWWVSNKTESPASPNIIITIISQSPQPADCTWSVTSVQ